MLPPSYSNLPDRFWSKVRINPVTGCWEWQGSTTSSGYGRHYVGKVKNLCHRLTASEVHGVRPPGLFALHHCDVKICVRPSHIYYGTIADNARDMAERGQKVIGERHGSAKITDVTAVTIRDAYNAGGVTERSLATEFGVHHSTIHDLVTGKTWSHV